MTQSEMRQLLAERGIQLTRSLGQSFLHDAHHLDRITAAAELGEGDRVLEIGPGLGPLTERLIAAAGTVLAIEKDARLIRVLEERFRVAQIQAAELQALTSNTADTCGLRLHCADALDLLKQKTFDWAGWKMVSNLPYSVASPILVELCSGARSPQVMVATLQLEVVRRLMARPATRDYGVLTLLVQLDFEATHWFKIPAGCFFPRPEVESACIVLKRRSTPLLPERLRRPYARIVKRAFSQRRKMMLKLLKQDWAPDILQSAYTRASLSPQVRAEAVSLGQFVQLTEELTGSDQRPGP